MQLGSQVKKGDEVGHFEFGGSCIIVCFEKSRIDFDEDLKIVSKRGILMAVQVGMSLGHATSPTGK
jgi:phosphatidylserine decarboxylase